MQRIEERKHSIRKLKKPLANIDYTNIPISELKNHISNLETIIKILKDKKQKNFRHELFHEDLECTFVLGCGYLGNKIILVLTILIGFGCALEMEKVFSNSENQTLCGFSTLALILSFSHFLFFLSNLFNKNIDDFINIIYANSDTRISEMKNISERKLIQKFKKDHKIPIQYISNNDFLNYALFLKKEWTQLLDSRIKIKQKINLKMHTLLMGSTRHGIGSDAHTFFKSPVFDKNVLPMIKEFVDAEEPQVQQGEILIRLTI